MEEDHLQINLLLMEDLQEATLVTVVAVDLEQHHRGVVVEEVVEMEDLVLLLLDILTLLIT